MRALFELGISQWMCLTTFLRSAWIRRGRGVIGLIIFPIRTLVYLFFLLLIQILFLRRGRMLFCLYAWLRKTDDVMDGDDKPPGRKSLEIYLDEKDRVIANFSDGEFKVYDIEDYMLLQFQRDMQRVGVNVTEDLRKIWYYLRCDFFRRENNTLAQRDWLNRQAIAFDGLIVGGCISLIGGDPTNFRKIVTEYDGLFTRTDWLHDLPEDLRKGICNIPKEAIEIHEINIDELKKCKSIDELLQNDLFRIWYEDEVQIAREQWKYLRISLGNDFGGSLKGKPIFAFLVTKLMRLWFNQSAITQTKTP